MDDDTTFDPALLHRLSRRALRPGVGDPGQARTVLTRHHGMTAGLPLAELASRYAAPAPYAGSAAPIVYARPAPSGELGSSAARGNAAEPGSPAPTGPGPVVAARRAPVTVDGPVVPAARPARPGAGPARPGPARPVTSPTLASAKPMIQRKVDAPSAPTTSPLSRAGSGKSSTTGVPGPPASRDRVARPGIAGAPGLALPDRAGPVPPSKPFTSGPVMAYLPSVPRRGPAMPGRSAPPPTGAGAADGPHSAFAAPAVVAHPAPASYPGQPGAEPSAVAPPAEAVSARQPQAQPVRSLPLPLAATATAPHDRQSPGTAAWQATGASSQPVVPGSAQAAPYEYTGPGGDAPRADRGTPQPRPAEAAPVDVAHITDQVHQRIVRRLAVEAERRGVRR